MSRILIIGPGKLGGQIAFHALRTGVVSKVFLAGQNYAKTEGIATDMGEAFPQCEIVPLSSYRALEPVELTFFTFSTLEWHSSIGVNDRLIEAKANVEIINQISTDADPELLGTIIVISNPVDILTWHTTLIFEKDNVFGFGISLDEHRINSIVTRLYGAKFERIQCLGEHGMHLVPLLSQVLSESQLSSELYDQVLKEAFARTGSIIKRVSIPFYGPLRELERVLDMLLMCKSGALTMSRYLREPFLGVEGVALGVPLTVEKGKFKGTRNVAINRLETELFVKASNAVIAQRQSLIA
jgi:malate/lactate dehydrogenase